MHIQPFKKIPARTTAEMVFNAIFWMNAFPIQNGISNIYSPMVTTQDIYFNIIAFLSLGAMCGLMRNMKTPTNQEQMEPFP